MSSYFLQNKVLQSDPFLFVTTATIMKSAVVRYRLMTYRHINLDKIILLIALEIYVYNYSKLLAAYSVSHP